MMLHTLRGTTDAYIQPMQHISHYVQRNSSFHYNQSWEIFIACAWFIGRSVGGPVDASVTLSSFGVYGLFCITSSEKKVLA